MRRWSVTVTLRLGIDGEEPEQSVRAAVQSGLPGAEAIAVRAEPLVGDGDYVLYERDDRAEYARVEQGPDGLRVRFGDGLIRPYEAGKAKRESGRDHNIRPGR